MGNLTFLTEDQFFGGNTSKQLSIFEKIGVKAAISDYAILLGGYVSNNFYSSNGSDLEHRTGYYWTRTDDGDNDARVVN